MGKRGTDVQRKEITNEVVESAEFKNAVSELEKAIRRLEKFGEVKFWAADNDDSVANYMGVEVNDNQILVRTEMWNKKDLGVMTDEQVANEADVIEAFESFYKNYNSLDLKVNYTPTGRDYTVAEIVEEMKNGTEIGKQFLHKIYYKAVLDLVQLDGEQ